MTEFTLLFGVLSLGQQSRVERSQVLSSEDFEGEDDFGHGRAHDLLHEVVRVVAPQTHFNQAEVLRQLWRKGVR